jgi:hypothetical protein
LALRDGEVYVARLARRPLPVVVGPRLRADATYLVTGGFGVLGAQVAAWLVEHGARRLILMGRTELPPRAAWPELRTCPVPWVFFWTGNVSFRADIFAGDASGHVSGQPFSWKSDVSGHFRLEGLSPGRTTFFARTESMASGESAPVSVGEGAFRCRARNLPCGACVSPSRRATVKRTTRPCCA